jgi:uncharacterized membrane protein (UPF0182 family)
MSERVGTADDALLRNLEALGLSEETVPLIHVVPLVHIAWSEGTVPELKRVIVAHQNQIVMEDTLEKALDRLFPSDEPRQQPVVATTGDGAAPEDDPLMATALEHYRRAMKAQRDGNWGLYGDEIQQLGEILERRNKNH